MDWIRRQIGFTKKNKSNLNSSKTRKQYEPPKHSKIRNVIGSPINTKSVASKGQNASNMHEQNPLSMKPELPLTHNLNNQTLTTNLNNKKIKSCPKRKPHRTLTNRIRGALGYPKKENKNTNKTNKNTWNDYSIKLEKKQKYAFIKGALVDFIDIPRSLIFFNNPVVNTYLYEFTESYQKIYNELKDMHYMKPRDKILYENIVYKNGSSFVSNCFPTKIKQDLAKLLCEGLSKMEENDCLAIEELRNLTEEIKEYKRDLDDSSRLPCRKNSTQISCPA
jgi:hypothetical protein